MYSRISITSISHAPSTFNKKCSILSFLGIYNLFMICGWYGMSHAIHFLFFPLIRTRNLKSYVVSSNIHTSISRPGHFPLIFRISFSYDEISHGILQLQLRELYGRYTFYPCILYTFPYTHTDEVVFK